MVSLHDCGLHLKSIKAFIYAQNLLLAIENKGKLYIYIYMLTIYWSKTLNFIVFVLILEGITLYLNNYATIFCVIDSGESGIKIILWKHMNYV